MLYSELIKQESEYTYSANVQFDIENDKKLARFIPNETTIELLREYFIDTIRTKPNHHARILYGSYGTGKSHFLTVLSLLLSKSFTEGLAFETFLNRVNEYDANLAQDIKAYVNDKSRKPSLIVPIVFDFDDFERCIYFSLTKKLNSIGVTVRFKTFYTQALEQLNRWKENKESLDRLLDTCEKEGISLSDLEQKLSVFDAKSEPLFNNLFNKMTFGVNFVYEVSNLAESLDQATEVISKDYSGIVFIFDEFGRYIEDNIKKIKVCAVQDLAEYCDHCHGNNHIILVSHKEISLYTQRINKAIANEWKKVEGRYKATPINDKQDQCLSLIRIVLIKDEVLWSAFKRRHDTALQAMYNEALDFHGFLVDVARRENPFEGGFPLHPISLYALDKLSKKVAQNERTFFTYLASHEENSLYRFLTTHEDDEFSFVGIDEIYDYFELSIKSLQSDASYEWYKKLQTAFSKNKSSAYDCTPEVRILKVIATIGVINDSSVLVANKKTITSVINLPKDIVSNAIDALLWLYGDSKVCPDRQHEKGCFTPGLRGPSGLAEGLRGLYENSRLPDQTLQASAPLHQRKGGTTGPFCERKLSCWKNLLEHYRSELSGSELVQPAEQHLPQSHRQGAAGTALQQMCRTDPYAGNAPGIAILSLS